MALRKIYKKIVVVIIVLGGVSLALLVYANKLIVQANLKVYQASDVPTSTTALIFGGGMKTATEMSDMQYDRVLVGAELYKNHRVQKLFLTGDDGGNHEDEISAMRKLAVEQGVNAADIMADPHGYRTYESCYREAYLYNVTSTIVISQSFHLPRIHYFCSHFGIATTEVSADIREYHQIWTPYIREWLARLKGWWQISISKPLPRTLQS